MCENSRGDVLRFEQIKSLLIAEGINMIDYVSVERSLKETVMPKANIECYYRHMTDILPL